MVRNNGVAMPELISWGIFVPGFTVVFGLVVMRFLLGSLTRQVPLRTFAIAGLAGGIGWGLAYWSLITFLPHLRLGPPHPWTPVLGTMTVVIVNLIMGWLFSYEQRHK